MFMGLPTSVAKIGSIAGPAVGGWVLGTSLPVRNIYAVLAVCPAVFAICIYLVGRMHSSILGREALAAVSETLQSSRALRQLDRLYVACGTTVSFS